MTQHTVKAYGDELNQLTAEVARMGGLAEAQVADAVESVARRDVALGRSVVERDAKLDGLQREIEKKAIRLIALRQPVASDLRRTLSSMKLATDLERTGDLAKNIAKRGLILAEGDVAAGDGIDGVGDLGLGQTAHAGDLGRQLVQFVSIGFDGVLGHGGS